MENKDKLYGECIGLVAHQYSDTRINLFWDNTCTNEESINIERSEDCINFIPIANISAGSLAYADFNLKPGTLYHYRVQACKGFEHSKYSNIASTPTKVQPKVIISKKKTLCTFVKDFFFSIINKIKRWLTSVLTKKN